MTRETENLSGAHALDAVTEGERSAYAAELVGDADARTETAEFTAAAAQLAHLTATPPPPALRGAVLASIRAVRPLPPEQAPVDQERTEPPTEQAPTEQARPDAVLRSLPTRSAQRRRRALGSLAAAAAILAAIVIVQPWRRGDPPIGATGPSATSSVTATQSPSGTRSSSYEAVAAAPDAKRYAIPMGDTAATIVLSRSMGKAVVVVSEMPTAPATKDYQAWLDVPGRGMVSAGLMPHDPTATTWDLDGDASSATAFGLTVEPAGGSKAPTTTPIALVNLPSA